MCYSGEIRNLTQHIGVVQISKNTRLNYIVRMRLHNTVGDLVELRAREGGGPSTCEVLTLTRHERCLPAPSPTANYNRPVLTVAIQLITVLNTNSVIHPGQ